MQVAGVAYICSSAGQTNEKAQEFTRVRSRCNITVIYSKLRVNYEAILRVIYGNIFFAIL